MFRNLEAASLSPIMLISILTITKKRWKMEKKDRKRVDTVERRVLSVNDSRKRKTRRGKTKVSREKLRAYRVARREGAAAISWLKMARLPLDIRWKLHSGFVEGR